MVTRRSTSFIIFLIIVISTHIFCDFDKVSFLVCTKDHHNDTYGRASATSDVLLYPRNNIAKKQVKSCLEFDVFNREIQILSKLRDFNHTPKILYTDYENHTIYMEYAGKQLTKDNIPSNWKIQIKEIIDGLKKRGVQHNDIKNAELLVKNGTIMLVDYGWTSEYEKKIPANWPCRLGEDCKAPWGLDDRYAITRAILVALGNGKEPEQNAIIKEMTTMFES